ncbi:MAG: N-acetyl-gamma-glutamyl-phosphate reductase, partial [Bacillota bacterium]
MSELRVGIVGGSGYVGGELLRILLRHPVAEVTWVTSESARGRYLHQRHPNLRGHTDLKFCSVDDLREVDVLFCALPHGRLRERIEILGPLGEKVIDLSADFRLRDRELARRYYPHLGEESPWASRFVYALPETGREDLRGASCAAGPGCLAATALLGLYPLAVCGLLGGPVVIEAKVGSTAAGASPGRGSHHPE